MNRFLLAALMALFVLPIAAQDDDRETLTLVTYDSFVIADDVRESFEDAHDVTLEIVRLSDAGAMVNQAILSKDNPLGDVLYGVDNTFLSRALDEDLFIPYEATGLDAIPEEFQLDAEEHRVTPVTFGDVCLNYDVSAFDDLAIPETLADLTDEAYEDMLVVQNPATSSPGLAFLLATIAVFGEEGDYTYLDYWADLRANDVLVVRGWTEAYYTEFSAVSADGTDPLVVSYASSPPAEVFFNDEIDVDDAPTGAIVAPETCFRQIEFAGILDGTEKEDLAQELIDFLIDVEFQESRPLTMFVFPVNEDAELPELFQEMVTIPDEPLSVSFDEIDANRERWIQEWTETVLR